MAKSGSILGNAVQRLEDPTLLTGAGKYADDLREDGHGARRVRPLARSPTARSRRSTSARPQAMPGVVAVYCGADGNDLGLAPFQGFPMMPAEAQPADLRQGHGALRRRHRRRRRRRDARAGGRRRRGDHRRLRPAARRDRPPPPRSPPTPRCSSPSTAPTSASRPTFGDDVDALEGADAVAEVTMVSQRLAGVPMESNAIVAVPGEPDGGLTCWVSHQAPHSAHAAMAPALGLEPEQLRVVCPWVGGGFGPKAAVYVEYLVAGGGRPRPRPAGQVDRDPLRGHGLARPRPRLRDDGQARRSSTTARSSGSTPRSSRPAGAYPAIGAILPMLTQMMSVGVYNVPKVRFDALTAITNNTTIGAYRGAGRPGGDAADRAGARRRRRRARHRPRRDPPPQLPRSPSDFPLTTLTGANYDSGEYAKALDAVLAAAGLRRAARRAGGAAASAATRSSSASGCRRTSR